MGFSNSISYEIKSSGVRETIENLEHILSPLPTSTSHIFVRMEKCIPNCKSVFVQSPLGKWRDPLCKLEFLLLHINKVESPLQMNALKNKCFEQS